MLGEGGTTRTQKKTFTKTHDTNIPRQPAFCMRNCINYTTAIEPFVLGRNITYPSRPESCSKKGKSCSRLQSAAAGAQAVFVQIGAVAAPNCVPQHAVCAHIECGPVGGALTSRQADPFRVIMGQDQPGSNCCCGVSCLFFFLASCV